MKPKNNKERQRSILKFGLLFLVSTALIVVTFFFDFDRMPIRENKILREKVTNIEKEIEFQKKFSSEIKEVISLMDSLKVDGANLEYTDALINNKMVELQNSIPSKDSTYRYNMYKNMVKSYVDMQALNVKLRSFKNVDEKLTQYQDELQRLNNEVSTKNRTIDALRRR